MAGYHSSFPGDVVEKYKYEGGESLIMMMRMSDDDNGDVDEVDSNWWWCMWQ